MQKINSIFFSIFIIFFSQIINASEKNLIFDIYPYNEDGTINVVVEIPAGTLEKWEVTKDGSQIKQQIENNKIRTINYLAYPFNYGFIPQTVLPVEENGDGDQLDVIIIGPSVKRGTVLKVKPIGTIIAIDNIQSRGKNKQNEWNKQNKLNVECIRARALALALALASALASSLA